MKDRATAVQCAAYHAASIARLQADAWAVWNASYDAPVPEAYRTVGLALYQQAVDQRIQTLFARSDEQNAQLDALLRSHPGADGAEPGPGSYLSSPIHRGHADDETRSDWVHGRAA